MSTASSRPRSPRHVIGPTIWLSAQPLKQGRGKIAMQRLHVILKAVLLRRTKTDMIDGKPLLSLPARNVHLVKIPFADSDELAFYTALKEKAQMQIKCVHRR